MAAQRISRGAFIVFEGVDRSGKSTQVKNLVEWLNQNGRPAKAMRFPERTTEIGTMIDAYLKRAKEMDDRALHLLFSANRWELRNELVRALESGTTLIVDRYAYSGVVFSAAKGLDVEWCKQPDAGLPRPDLVLFLDISVEKAANRSDYGQERYENTEFQQNVQSVFNQLQSTEWKVIDASGAIEEVGSAIRDDVTKVVDRCKSDAPCIGRLW
jgi:dTMP kinase